MQGYSKVAGTTFIKDIDLSKLVEGSELVLIREKNNQFDPNAVAIYGTIGVAITKIGYVRKELAESMAKEIDNGEIIVAEITQITGGKDGQNYGVNYKFW